MSLKEIRKQWKEISRVSRSKKKNSGVHVGTEERGAGAGAPP